MKKLFVQLLIKKIYLKSWNKWLDTECVVCGDDRKEYLVIAHVKTRGARPDWKYKAFNCVTLCFFHHIEQEGSTYKFAINNIEYMNWLLDNGWFVLHERIIRNEEF